MYQAAPNTKQYPELEKLVAEKDTKGTETPMKISFRAVNTFDLWVRPILTPSANFFPLCSASHSIHLFAAGSYC